MPISKFPYLTRRGQTYHFRCRVPRPLVTRLGRRELKRSLRTTDTVLARGRALAVGACAFRLFETVRRNPLLDRAAIIDLMRSFYAQRLVDDLAARMAGGPSSVAVVETHERYSNLAPMSATGILWSTSRKPTKHPEAWLAEIDGRLPFIRPGLNGNVVPKGDVR